MSKTNEKSNMEGLDLARLLLDKQKRLSSRNTRPSALSRLLFVSPKKPLRTQDERPAIKLSKLLINTYININNSYRNSINNTNQDCALSIPAPLLKARKVLNNQSKPLIQVNLNEDYVFKIGEVLNSKYQVVKGLGKGSFGQVVECNIVGSNEKVAIKIIKNRKSFFTQAQKEAHILDILNKKDRDDSKHIVRMKDTFIHRNHFCIVYELLAQTMYELLYATDFKGISINLARDFAKQILITLEFLNDWDVIHCDLKPENILINPNKKDSLKIIDFGSACTSNARIFTYIQSRFYRSPEVILGLPYTTSIDIWSLGCLLIELILGEPLFPGKNEHDQLSRIYDLIGHPPNRILQQGSSKKINKFYKVSTTLKSNKKMMEDGEEDDMCMSEDEDTVNYDFLFKPDGSVGGGGGGGGKREGFVGSIREMVYRKFNERLVDDRVAGGGNITDYYQFHLLVTGMLKFDAMERVTAGESLKHRFFRESFEVGINTHHSSIMVL